MPLIPFKNLPATFPVLSWDIIILVISLVAAFLYGLSLGKKRLILFLVSTYIALAILASFPFMDFEVGGAKISESFAIQVGVFMGILLLAFLILSRLLLGRPIKNMPGRPRQKPKPKFLEVFLLSICQVGFLISIILSFLPEDTFLELAPLTERIFTTKIARFIWIILPILALALIKRRAK